MVSRSGLSFMTTVAPSSSFLPEVQVGRRSRCIRRSGIQFIRCFVNDCLRACGSGAISAPIPRYRWVTLLLLLLTFVTRGVCLLGPWERLPLAGFRFSGWPTTIFAWWQQYGNKECIELLFGG